jgi:hypothetical protein
MCHILPTIDPILVIIQNYEYYRLPFHQLWSKRQVMLLFLKKCLKRSSCQIRTTISFETEPHYFWLKMAWECLKYRKWSAINLFLSQVHGCDMWLKIQCESNVASDFNLSDIFIKQLNKQTKFQHQQLVYVHVNATSLKPFLILFHLTVAIYDTFWRLSSFQFFLESSYLWCNIKSPGFLTIKIHIQQCSRVYRFCWKWRTDIIWSYNFLMQHWNLELLNCVYKYFFRI